MVFYQSQTITIKKELVFSPKTIQDIPEVIECYRMSGETDYLLKVVVSDIESYDAFYKNLIEKVQFLKVTSNFAIEEIKKHY